VNAVNQHSKTQPPLPPSLPTTHPVRENESLIAVMKEAKMQSGSQSPSTSTIVKSNEMILNQDVLHHENPYIFSIMKEMLAKRNSITTADSQGLTTGNLEEKNLTSIVKEVNAHDENQKKLRASQDMPNGNLIKIMDEIVEHESKHQKEQTPNLIEIANDIKKKELRASAIGSTSSPMSRNPSLPKNPRQKASPNGDFTTSAIDIYAHDEKSFDPNQAMTDAEIKSRAFSRLSSPDVSDEASRLKYGVKSFSTRPNESPELDVPVGVKQNFGMVRVTAHYDELRSRLSITVHEAK